MLLENANGGNWRMMHDGASLTFRDAIQRHGGEAAHVTKQFEKLKREDQEAIIEFLKSLSAQL